MICVSDLDTADIEDNGKLYDIEPIFSGDIGKVCVTGLFVPLFVMLIRDL
jgi:hypothetical protein